MNGKPDLAERLLTAVNELDIDFSKLTVVGWLVSFSSLGVAGGVAYLACGEMVRQNGLGRGVGLVFFLIMVTVTTIMFLALRWAFRQAGLSLTKQPVAEQSVTKQAAGLDEGQIANRDTLQRMANAGMDLTAVHKIDFWHHFKTKENAVDMGRKAKELSYHVVSIEPNEESAAYDVQIQVELVPTLSAINQTEQTLAAIAAQYQGQADGWGVLQQK